MIATSVGGHSVVARHHFEVMNVPRLNIFLCKFDNFRIATARGRQHSVHDGVVLPGGTEDEDPLHMEDYTWRLLYLKNSLLITSPFPGISLRSENNPKKNSHFTLLP